LFGNFNQFQRARENASGVIRSEIGWPAVSAAHGRVTFSSNPAIGKWPRHIKAYYSTVFEQSAPQVWKIVRDFNTYPVWEGGAGESAIEDGKSGDAVGAVRRVLYQDRRIRQRLQAQSDAKRSQTYEFCVAATLAVATN
jgi:hypothetical protein